MKNNIPLILAFFIFLNTVSCKKETDSQDKVTIDTLLFGLWKKELIIATYYDNTGNIFQIDTVPIVDTSGNSLTAYEKYTPDSIFYSFNNSINDTAFSCTYLKTIDSLKINSPLLPFVFFNNRKIDALSATELITSQKDIRDTIKIYTEKFSRQ